MKKQRIFSLGFKRQVVEDFLGGEGAAQICRKYNIYPSLLYHWKDMYSRGRFDNEPTEAGALKDRVEKLERLVGKLTLENEILKKACRNSLSRSPRNGKPSRYGDALVLPSDGGVR
jgi:transposase